MDDPQTRICFLDTHQLREQGGGGDDLVELEFIYLDYVIAK